MDKKVIVLMDEPRLRVLYRTWFRSHFGVKEENLIFTSYGNQFMHEYRKHQPFNVILLDGAVQDLTDRDPCRKSASLKVYEDLKSIDENVQVTVCRVRPNEFEKFGHNWVFQTADANQISAILEQCLNGEASNSEAEPAESSEDNQSGQA